MSQNPKQRLEKITNNNIIYALIYYYIFFKVQNATNKSSTD